MSKEGTIVNVRYVHADPANPLAFLLVTQIKGEGQVEAWINLGPKKDQTLVAMASAVWASLQAPSATRREAALHYDNLESAGQPMYTGKDLRIELK